MSNTNWMVHGTDLTEYLQACKEADLSTFKSDRRLTRIFEHASVRQGNEYLRLIARQTPALLRHKFTNDKQGGPLLYHFGETNRSPSTMQYIGVLSNLLTHFGSLAGKRIVEIGGGYGGQCRTILDYQRPACYHIIDLPEVVSLQQRYLAQTIAQCFTEPTGAKYDICISNYALSEIPHNEIYVDGVLALSEHGYITCNTDYVTLPWEHKRLPDIGSEAVGNYILIW